MHKFSSLENHDHKVVACFLDNPLSKQYHHIQEKLDGSHVSLEYYVDIGWVIHSRNNPLDPSNETPFHGYKHILNDLIKCAEILRGKYGDNIVIHGELIGCLYPGFKIEKEFSYFQNKIIYTDKLIYITYDIYEKGVGYWNTTPALKALGEAGFITSPIIKTYNDLETALTHSEDFDSTIPALLSMPPLNIPNRAEGIIIRPEKNYYHKKNNRAVIKKKNVLFREKNLSSIKSSQNTTEMDIINQYSFGTAGDNRINTVKSKCSEDINMKELASLFVEDVIQDMAKDGHIFENRKKIEKKIRTNFGAILYKKTKKD